MKKLLVLATLLNFTIAHSQTLSFTDAPGSPFTIGGSNLRSNTAVDLNHDGIQDLVIANYGNGTVSVLLGNGNGSFTNASGSPITVGSGALYIAVGDFNHDGKWDLAVANYSDNSVSILMGNGNGTFTQAAGSPITVGNLPYCIDTAHFDADTNQDIAVVNLTDGSTSILLGNGNGTFTSAVGSPMPTGVNPYHVVTADFNGDGHFDMAITDGATDSVLIYLGNGNGTFTEDSSLSVGSFTRTVRAGDFNNDGKQDLVVTNLNDNSVYIFLGRGNGRFKAAAGSPMTIGSYPYDVAIADFNSDGNKDLAITNSSQVYIYYGAGNGTFANASGSPISTAMSDMQSVAVADFNGDSKLDLAVSDWVGDKVEVLINTSTNLENVTNVLNRGNSNITVSPNPNDGKFNLEIRNYELGMKYNIEVYNMLGEKVYTGNANTSLTQVDMSNAAKGIYLGRVITEQGKLVATQKLIIK